MSIRQLPEHVVERIKSLVAVTSLSEAACGLLRNSLDAQATRVNLHVDYTRGNCTVEDDGLGISPDEFRENGGLGKLHHTSRFPPGPDAVHGKHGNFLASVGTLSLLSVTSHHHRHNSHNSLSIHHGKVLARHLPSRPEQRFESFDHGTRVSVRDLFGSMPVRVKYRATQFSDSAAVDKEFTRLVHDVVALLLCWPNDVSVFLRESNTKRELRLKSPPSLGLVVQTSRLLTQASLAGSTDREAWVPVTASSGETTIKGCISLDPAPNRRVQFLSLGVCPIRNDYDANVLYDEVNNIFSSSSFGVIEDSETGDSDPQTASSRAKPRKGIERWPMFYLQITMPEATETGGIDDVLNSSHQQLGTILDLIKATCYSFLKSQHLRPHKVHMSTNNWPLSTSKTLGRSRKPTRGKPAASTDSGGSRASSRGSLISAAQSRTQSPFDDWRRVKVGAPKPSLKNRDRQSVSVPPQGSDLNRLVGEGGCLLRKPFEEANNTDDDTTQTQPAKQQPTNHGIESISSGSNSQATSSQHFSGVAKPDDDSRPPARKLRVLERRPKPPPSPWLQGVLDSWHNPIFETTQANAPRLPDMSVAVRGRPHQCHHGGGEVNWETRSIALKGRVSRVALSNAQVVAQVDCKFILLTLPLDDSSSQSESTRSLVMLDQHAADERCRLEDLMADYFKPDAGTGAHHAVVESLPRPILFEVSSQEGSLLKLHRAHFDAWGIRFQLQPQPAPGPGNPAAECKVKVTGLPPSILERCRAEPRLVVELMRKEIWALEDGTAVFAKAGSSSQKQASDSATASFLGCPRGILDLLHSRSCRSAIMFNDELTKDECTSLVRRLATCAFPFQCAHGRPSMVPLVDLGPSSSSGCFVGDWRRRGAEVDGGIAAWKRWVGE